MRGINTLATGRISGTEKTITPAQVSAASFGAFEPMPNLKILCVEQFSDIGGGQRSLLDLLPEFQQRGWMATVALPDEGPLCAAVTALRCETEMLRRDRKSAARREGKD